eukprot:gene40581-50198_t
MVLVILVTTDKCKCFVVARQADSERLTADQIEANRNELADLERLFLERVVQLNSSKSMNPEPVK